MSINTDPDSDGQGTPKCVELEGGNRVKILGVDLVPGAVVSLDGEVLLDLVDWLIRRGNSVQWNGVDIQITEAEKKIKEGTSYEVHQEGDGINIMPEKNLLSRVGRLIAKMSRIFQKCIPNGTNNL